MNCFSGTATSLFKSPTSLFLLLSKNKNEQKPYFQFHNIVIINDHAVPLGCCGPLRCGPLRVMLGPLFIHRLHFCCLCPIFSDFQRPLFDIEAQ